MYSILYDPRSLRRVNISLNHMHFPKQERYNVRVCEEISIIKRGSKRVNESKHKSISPDIDVGRNVVSVSFIDFIVSCSQKW